MPCVLQNFVRRMHVSEFGNEADMHIALRAIQSHVLADAQERGVRSVAMPMLYACQPAGLNSLPSQPE